MDDEDDEDDDWDSSSEDSEVERTFANICEELQNKDPRITNVDLNDGFTFTNPRARRLGEALEGNPHVTALYFNIYGLKDEAGQAEDRDCVALLLRFIRESPALRTVDLSALSSSNPALSVSILRRFFLAIAANPGIEELSLRWANVHPDGFDTLMETTQSLQKLEIRLCDFGAAASRDMAEALCENQKLESLTICNGGGLVEAALLRLGSHPRLRELVLDGGIFRPCMTEANALGYFLRSSTTLEHLTLVGYGFNKELLEPIMEGVHSSHSLAKVSVVSCKFDVEATLLFQGILKPKNEKNSIRELHFENVKFAGLRTGDVVVNILLPQPAEESASKAEQITLLEVLDMSEAFGLLSGDFISICGTLGANASTIQLQRFRYRKMDVPGSEALVGCLSKLLYLKELSTSEMAPDVSSRNLLRALQHNGSLQDVSITASAHAQRQVFTEDQSRRVQLCFKRNQNIPALVAQPRLDNDDVEENSDKTDRFLFPTLFSVSQQARRTAPNSMLIGLMALGDSIGPRGN